MGVKGSRRADSPADGQSAGLSHTHTHTFYEGETHRGRCEVTLDRGCRDATGSTHSKKNMFCFFFSSPTRAASQTAPFALLGGDDGRIRQGETKREISIRCRSITAALHKDTEGRSTRLRDHCGAS